MSSLTCIGGNCNAGKTVYLTISIIKNPFFLLTNLATNEVIISTLTNADIIINSVSLAINSITPALISTNIITATLTRTVTTPAFVTNLQIKFTAPSLIRKNSKIKITLPTSQILMQSSFPFLKKTSDNTNIIYTIQTISNNLELTFTEYCSIGLNCPIGTEVSLILEGMINPNVEPTLTSLNSAKISILTNLLGLVDETKINLYILPNLIVQQINSIAVSRSSNKAGDQATYVFTFSISAALNPDTS